jgi:hypothetical protein
MSSSAVVRSAAEYILAHGEATYSKAELTEFCQACLELTTRATTRLSLLKQAQPIIDRHEPYGMYDWRQAVMAEIAESAQIMDTPPIDKEAAEREREHGPG